LFFNRDNQTLMAVFTDLERTKRFAGKGSYCLVMKCEKQFRSIRPESGIVINPGCNVGLEIPAKGVKEIVRDIGIA
jgi:hypothetical protein